MSGQRPEPFSAYTTPDMWDDPHISAQMLNAHLDPDLEAASRRHDFIDRGVEWIIVSLDLRPGARALDLGCGPGLYACRLARRRISVYGIDVSRRSVDYARAAAATQNLDASFAVANYLTDDLGGPYDLALLAYEDYCVLSPQQRRRLLEKVAAALAPGGWFAMDVTSPARFAAEHDAIVRASNLMGGFWAPTPYEGVHETWTYPQLRLILDRFTITTQDDTRQYWNWTQCLTPEEVATELRAGGFQPPSIFGDLTGAPYDPESQTFAVVAHRR